MRRYHMIVVDDLLWEMRVGCMWWEEVVLGRGQDLMMFSKRWIMEDDKGRWLTWRDRE